MSVDLLLARALVALGVVCAALALLALYVRTTALDDNEARSLAHALIAQPDLRAQVAATSVDRLYATVNVTALLRRELPAGGKAAAGPLAAALRGSAQQGIDLLLRQPAVQGLWTDAVYRAHRQLVAIIENKHQTFPVSNGQAVLDLRPLVVRAGDRLGLSANLSQLVPPAAGRITIFRAGDLQSAQLAIRVLNFVADWFWVLAIGSWAAALWLARGARRRLLRSIAGGLVLAGVALLAVRAAVGHWVVHSLVAAEWRPVISTAWSVITVRLGDSAWTTIGVGVVALLGLWLQGSPRARGLRAALAPVIRAPEVGYGVLAVLLGLLFWWGQTIETRELTGSALIAAGSLAGFAFFRRTLAREFPDARLDGVWESLREHVISPPRDDVERLERLARLHESGELTDEEFAAAKRVVLGPAERASV